MSEFQYEKWLSGHVALTERDFYANFFSFGAWRTLTLALTVVLLGLPYGAKAFGQAEQGTFSGVVADRSGAVVPGASVTAKEVATQTVSATTSNQDGYYTLPYLKPGTYNLTATAKGFATASVIGVHLTVNLRLGSILRLMWEP